MNNYFQFKKITSKEFDKISKKLKLPNIPIEQSTLWGQFDDAIVGRTFLGSFQYSDHHKTIAIASATLYHQKGREWIWIKHGPLFTKSPSPEIVKKMCSTLKLQFKNIDGMSPVFIRLSMPLEVSPMRLPFEHTMYDETILVNLDLSIDEILAQMNQSGRQGIRRATKYGVQIKEVTRKRVQVFTDECYEILTETGRRGGFGIHPLTLYTAMLETLPENARLYCAYYKQKIVAWAITTEYASQALYYYGASNNQARDIYAPYLLHIEIIKAMKIRGNKSYDFMGIAGKNYPSLKNVTQFKLKFSKNIIKVPQTYDLPLNTIKYNTLTLAISVKRKIASLLRN